MAVKLLIGVVAWGVNILRVHKNKFRKCSRLIKRREFEKVSKYGSRCSGKWIFLEILNKKEGSSRLGITVTKKFGPSHERNRFKRLVREAYRTLPIDRLCVDFIVRPRGNHDITLKMQEVQNDLKICFNLH